MPISAFIKSQRRPQSNTNHQTMSSLLNKFLSFCLISTSCASIATTNQRQTIEGVSPLLFNGLLLNDLQNPISEAHVQFWQTDPNGLYDHPNADGSDSLDSTFQYFGTAKTDSDGSFWFLTHRPGIYTGRPTHFHFKIWIDGENVLTSQFYFADENTNYSDMQIIELRGHEFDDGTFGFVANKTIVVDFDLGGDGPFTPSDMEGPFYPVVDFFKFDNNLINATVSSDTALGFSTGAPTKTPSMYSLDELTEAQSPSPTTKILPVLTNAPFLFSDESDETTDAPTMIPDSRTTAQPTLSLDPLQIEPTVIINNTQQTLAASTADARSSSRDTKLTFLPTLVVALYSAFLLAK
jgi:protocatechuate 3,4-dioxygenase beta subunit